jgi:hypothetical protein
MNFQQCSVMPAVSGLFSLWGAVFCPKDSPIINIKQIDWNTVIYGTEIYISPMKHGCTMLQPLKNSRKPGSPIEDFRAFLFT